MIDLDDMKDIKKFIVSISANIRTAIKQMDKGGIGFLVIVDENEKVVGVVTDGDFRRAVLNGIHLTENISLITNTKYRYFVKGYSQKEAAEYFRDEVVKYLPVLENGKVVDLVNKDSLDYKITGTLAKGKMLNLPVVIMAGGKGTRLEPFTHILPKALIPIGEKPIIEIIMDEFAKYGMKDFFVSVNRKSKMIKAYFDDHGSDYNFTYVDEDKPLGTAGALKYLEGKFDSCFFISNCDIIIKSDYSAIVQFHKEYKYDLTLVGSLRHQIIPYGVCEYENGGLLKNIKEKPEFDYMVNTGLYLVNPDILRYIPKDKYFDMTELINVIQKKGHRVGVYPVSEKSWLDVGQWEEYNSTIRRFNK